MEIYTATLIVKKHLEWQNDKRNLPKVNDEKLKEATEILTNIVKKLTMPDVINSGKNTCSDCGDRGWLYDKDGRRTGTCPCHCC